jgi:hypothetical protein
MTDHWIALQRATLFFGVLAVLAASLSGVLAR